MSCYCKDRLPCPVHGIDPLPLIVTANIKTIVIHIYEHWPVDKDKTWFATVTTDAFLVFKSENKPTMKLAVDAAAEWIKRK